MTDDEKKVIDDLTKGFGDLKTQLTSIAASIAGPAKVEANSHTIAMVEPHAKACEAAADSMMAAGIGGHPQHGHVVVLRKMAGHMRAAAAVGHIPHIFRDHDYLNASATELRAGEAVDFGKQFTDLLKPITDKLASFETVLADVKASAVKASPAPERKTLPASITQLLAKAGIEPEKQTGKLEITKVDEMLKGMETGKRLEFKIAMKQHGLID